MKDRDVKKVTKVKAGEVGEGRTIVLPGGQRFRVDRRRRPKGNVVRFSQIGYGSKKPQHFECSPAKKLGLVHR